MTILNQYGKPFKARRQRGLDARYDVSRTTTDNIRHWVNADNLSPSASVDERTRRTVRSRARYECENNPYARGLMLTLANDTIGTGPRLELMSPNKKANQQIEREFHRWLNEIRAAEKLRTSRMSKGADGESFLMKINNPRLTENVQLDVRLFEGDQVAHPDMQGSFKQNEVDGIEFDEAGNPRIYHLLKQHPGADNVLGMQFDFRSERIAAKDMVHLYREDRPEQRRGISEIAAALDLFAVLRRFRTAVVAAAETAASFAAVMYTDSPDVDPDNEVDPMDAIPLELRAMLTLPAGWKVGQVQSEQPSTTYEMFHDKLLNEIGRCLNIPFNVIAGNSKDYNFASGRLDHKMYFKSIEIERHYYECKLLNRLFGWWFDEAVLMRNVIPGDIGPIREVPHRWGWDAHEHVDPLKQASADILLWNAGLTNDEELWSKANKDPDEQYQRLENQKSNRERLGLPLPAGQSGGPANQEKQESGAGDE